MTATPQKITFGELRASGVRDVLIYCRDHRCTYQVEDRCGWLADDVRLSDIEDRPVCQVCGQPGADVRTNFPPARVGANLPSVQGTFTAGVGAGGRGTNRSGCPRATTESVTKMTTAAASPRIGGG